MRSMTGYGRCQLSRDGREVTVEIKTVNHRFLDLSCRLPRSLSFAEDAVRRQSAAVLCRGHADVNVSYANLRQDAREIQVDEGLALQYKNALARLKAAVGGDDDCGLSFIASQPDVLRITVREEDQEAVLSLISDAMAAALGAVTQMREKEGEALQADLAFHLGQVSSIRDQIAALAPRVPLLYQERLKNRVRELGAGELDEQRLHQEVALMADRCAIDEELSRLESHLSQMREALDGKTETGRRLDFLTQELNREVNTIGSKASDADITKLVVRAKSEIEKLREQVQNVE